MSCVDTSLEKYDRLTLTVDGEPFFYNGIQVRADNAKDQLKFSDEQIKEMYLQAGKDGYTVVNSQVRWSDVQPDTEIWAGETGQLTDGERVSSAESGTVSGTSGNESTAYFTFELPELDSDCAAAKFRIRVSSISAAASLSVSDADGVSDAVIEAPSWRIVNALSLKGASEGGSNGYFDINVADIVNAHKGDSSVTLAVTTTAESTVTVYGAAAEGNNRPLLKLSRDDVYDWTYLDKLLDYAYEAGVKFELLWFATDTCQQSHELRLPYYVHENYQKSLKADGTPARNLNATNTYIMCKNDPYLRAKEKEVLETVFDHIAEYDAAHGSSKLVVGCQVANETAVGRLHSGTTEDRYFGHCYCDTCLAKLAASESEVSFREDTLWGYLNNLASAVKDSDYSVWTRENNYMTTDTNVLAYNEKQRSTVGTDLDFIGLDPYSAVSGADNNYLYSFGHESCTYKNHTYNYAQGKNLPLVMEYGGNNKNLDQAIIACLAGGANLNVYELLSGKENFGTYVAVRDADGNATGFEPRTSYTYASGSDANWSEENWIERIRSLNTMLGKVKHQLASLKPDGVGGDKLVYFNPKSDEDTPSTKQVGKYSITYTTTENGNGIAIADAENQAVLLTTKAAEFKLADIQPETALSVETGYYEGTKWIKAGEKEFTVTDNILAISASAYECIRITLTEPQPCVKISADYDENGVLINASFEDILTNDITPTENTKTHKTFYWKSLNDMLPIAAAQ